MNYNFPPNNNQINLPPIVPQINPFLLEKERQNNLQKSLGFIHNRLVRSISASNPIYNYPLYSADMANFCFNYPQSLFYYRPMRYFFQRPVQLDYENAFPHQKMVIDQLKERDDKIRNMLEKKSVKYGIPKKMEEILKNGEIVHLPTATVVSAADLKKKQEEYNKLQEQVHKLSPEGQREVKLKNKKLRDAIRKIVYFNDFILDMKTFAKASQEIKENEFVLIQATKANINELKNFVVKMLKNIENFCVKFFGDKITIKTNDKQKKEDSIFIIKSFVHQLFNDLSSAFVMSNDIPENLREILKSYIKEKSLLPPGYLTTFEFNRLEFDVNIRLNRMTLERQSLMLGFLLLYRVLLIDIFKNYLTYFPKIRDLGNPINDILNNKVPNTRRRSMLNNNLGNNNNNILNRGKNNPLLNNPLLNNPNIQSRRANNPNILNNNQNQMDIINNLSGKNNETKMLYYKKRKMNIRNNLAFNFNFIIQVLDYIFRTAFEKTLPIFNDYFKSKHLYGILVFSTNPNYYRQLFSNNNTDDIEIMSGLYEPSQECEIFLKENARWIHMYQLNTVQLCSDLAKMIMSDEIKNNNNNNILSNYQNVENNVNNEQNNNNN